MDFDIQEEEQKVQNSESAIRRIDQICISLGSSDSSISKSESYIETVISDH